MRKGWAGVARAVLVSVLLAMVVAAPAYAACSRDHLSLRGPGGQSSFTVEIADTDAERALGLMNRRSMPRFSGMLFVWETPQHAVFWMENTLIPLDMLFIDARGVVQSIHANAVPMDRTAIDGGYNIRYVLEINGGMAAMLGLQPGAEVRSALIDQENAAWPCE